MDSPAAPHATTAADPAPGAVTRTYSRRRPSAKRSQPGADPDRDHQAHGGPRDAPGTDRDENQSQELDPAARLELRRALLGIPSSPPNSPKSAAPAASAEATTDHVGPSKASKKPRTAAAKGPLDAFFLVRKPPPVSSSRPDASAPSNPTPIPTSSPPDQPQLQLQPQPQPAKRLIQSRLNFGQRNQGATLCPDCGMHYLPTSESDRKLHAKFHKASQLGIEYPGYRTDTLLATTPTFRIIYHAAFPATSTKPLHTKLAAVHAHIDAALGAAPTDPESTCTYLAISHPGRRLMGALVMDTERVRAWRVASPDQHVDWDVPVSIEAVGVSRVWVDAKSGRRGVASALLDAMRERARVERDTVAFSQPTEAGWGLARRWVGREEVLVFY